MEIEEVRRCEPLPLLSLNHVSLVVKCVRSSVRFYEDVLGFLLIKRPSSFNFHGAWLFNYGIGIHLLQNESVDAIMRAPSSRPINPKDNHLSFQCTDVEVVKRRLEEMRMKYVSGVVEDEGIRVDQVFFHDPDGYMIEICNCDNLPVLPLSPPASACRPQFGCCYKKMDSSRIKCGLTEASIMMENLSLEMLNFSF